MTACKEESGAYILGGVVVIMFCVQHLNALLGRCFLMPKALMHCKFLDNGYQD
jgi:hypothetical protein